MLPPKRYPQLSGSRVDGPGILRTFRRRSGMGVHHRRSTSFAAYCNYLTSPCYRNFPPTYADLPSVLTARTYRHQCPGNHLRFLSAEHKIRLVSSEILSSARGPLRQGASCPARPESVSLVPRPEITAGMAPTGLGFHQWLPYHCVKLRAARQIHASSRLGDGSRMQANETVTASGRC